MKKDGVIGGVTGGWALREYHSPCEDYGGYCGIQPDGVAAAVVADGVSSAWHSELASRAAVEAFLAAMGQAKKGFDTASWHNLFDRLVEAVGDCAKNKNGRQPDQWPATTLLAAIYDSKTPDQLTLTYVGDGAIWLVRGDRQAGISILLPIATRGGALQGILHPLEEHVSPAIIQVEPAWPSGWLVLIATDGVPLKEGVGVQEIVACLFRAFKESGGAAAFTQDIINRTLKIWLAAQKISDDATLAVLLSPDTLVQWEAEN